MTKLTTFIIGVSTLTLCACGAKESIVGKWVQPVPGLPEIEQGFVLEADGSASSVNMATLAYDGWERLDNRLILSGKSIGNHQTIAFSDTFAIEKLTQDSLILKRGMLILEYTRETPTEETVTSPTTMTGTLTIGHETRSLTVEGDTMRYWIVDKTGSLLQRYDSITNGTKNGHPVHVRLQVIDMGHSDEGFARSYDRVLQVVGIDSMSAYDPQERLFDEGIRVEAVDSKRAPLYIIFSQDSLTADLYKPGGDTHETLHRRILPDGGLVWNTEDDDTKNLRFADGRWTVSLRDGTMYRQPQCDNDINPGKWIDERYEGTLPATDTSGIKYRLKLRHREHSGDGRFLLRLTYPDSERVYTGRRYTQRGIPSDNDATVWQLVADDGTSTFNFLYKAGDNTLVPLNDK